MQTKYRSNKFTLIELLVVIGVMGLLMSLSMPEFNDLIKGNKVNSVVSKIGSELSYCRTYAISKRRKTQFILEDPGSATTSAKYETKYLNPPASWLGLNNRTPQKLESTVTVSGITTITFRPNGSVEENSLSIKVKGRVGGSDISKTLEVNKYTGKVKYVDNDNDNDNNNDNTQNE